MTGRSDQEADLAAWAAEALDVELTPWQERALRGYPQTPRPGQRGTFSCEFIGGPMDGQTMAMPTFEPIIRANVAPSQPVWLEDLGLADPPAAIPLRVTEYHFNHRLRKWLWQG